MKIYCITGNKDKFEELHSIIPSLIQKNIDLPEIQELDPQKIIEVKLNEAMKHVNGAIIVEDTSLYIQGLYNLPGPLIKWFLISIGIEGLARITQLTQNTEAIAKTVIGFATHKKDIHFFEGEIKGNIVLPRGTNGFGWDPIFQPKGSDKTFGELSQSEKMKFSMRRLAVLKLQDYLQDNTKQ